MLKLFPSVSEDVGDMVCVCWKLVENEEFCKMMKAKCFFIRQGDIRKERSWESCRWREWLKEQPVKEE